VDADIHGAKSRFGYFSIPYSSFLGDGHYSREREKVYRTEDRKVLTENRGIFTKPPKKGRFTDAYFSNTLKVDPRLEETIKQKAENEEKQHKEFIQTRKAEKKNFKAEFRPGGPQEHKDYLEREKKEYQVPITKEVDKKLKINHERRTVYMENRGIYTQPPKRGTSAYPGIYFSASKEEYKKLQKGMGNRSQSAKLSKQKDQMGNFAFRPASLMKNNTFQKDMDVYGEEEKKVKKLIEEATEDHRRNKSKYKPDLPETAKKHDNAFKPAKRIKTGRETLFSQVNGVPFISEEKVVIPVKDRDKAFVKPFVPNRMHDHTNFSRPASSFKSNLKKEFYRAFHN